MMSQNLSVEIFSNFTNVIYELTIHLCAAITEG